MAANRPILLAAAPGFPPQSAPGRSVERRGGKVLVVEDVALIRLTTVDMVEQIGFAAAEAGDASEALTILRSDSAIEILLTDLGLPGMDGRQLVEEAFRLKPLLKVIVASGYSTRDEEAAWASANVTYLSKPFDMRQLRAALES